MALLLKMNSLVYIHPENQFYAPDTDYKIPVSLGTNVFVTVSHDVTHNLPYNLVSVSKLQNTSCSDEFIFDNCVRDVSNSKGRFNLLTTTPGSLFITKRCCSRNKICATIPVVRLRD